MAFEPLTSAETSGADHTEHPERLSQSGQMIGWGVYGGLVLIGFFFGIVTGYERPRTITVARVVKEKESPKTETPRPKLIPTPEPQPNPPTPTPPVVNPPVETPAPPPKKDPPVVVAPPPKKDPPVVVPPKKEEVKVVVFKEVVPILRTHCFVCHGTGLGKPKADVDLTSVAKIMKSAGKLLVPGKPDQSELYTSITERDMPKDKPKPTDKELMLLRNWILSGAKERRRPVRSRNRNHVR